MKKLKRISLTGLWLTVVLLVIMILATLALLGSFILGYVAGDRNVIDLMRQSNAMAEEYSDDAFPAGALPEMDARDEKVKWETNTSVDLFKNSYTDANGKVTVESALGDKVIAPGTSNTYEFTLKNTGNISLDYTLSLEGIFQMEDRELPLYVRLRQGDRWIMGGEEAWLSVSQMNEVVEENTLARDKSAVYQFEWMWPYEGSDESDALLADLNDTLLGNASVNVNTNFLLNITVTSVITPGAAAEFDSGASVLARYILTCTLGALALGSGLWLIILLFLRRNVWFTGLVTPPVPGTVTMDKQEDTMAFGRFTFSKTHLGKHKLKLIGGEMTIRFKHDRKVVGVSIRQEKGETVVYMGSRIRAVELYFVGAAVNPLQWAAIDKKHNVYTPLGIVPAVAKRNRTPGGLKVDEKGRYGADGVAVNV